VRYAADVAIARERFITLGQTSMKTRSLGATGVAISKVALGCGNFGGIGSPLHLIGRGLDREASFAALDEAIALGVNLLDTAHSYAGGASERFIGEWLVAQPREVKSSTHIATKVGNVVSEEGISADLSPQNILVQLSGSLERLGVPRVTFCLSHAPDPQTPVESTLEGFAQAMEAGLVSHIGACNVDAEQLTAAMEASARYGLPRYEWVQNEYNLLHRGDEAALLRLCEHYGIGYTPFSPLAGGVLSGKYVHGQPPPPDSRLALRPEGHVPSEAVFEAIGRLEREAERRECSTGALALAWVMSHPLITAAVCGPAREAEHLRCPREALGIDLDERARAEIGAWFA
jgi:aryl-alcohol dehydrogenase-like predicted oxidoreductase